MQSISNKRLDIGITGTPLDLAWIHFSGGGGIVLRLALNIQSHLPPKLRKKYSYNSTSIMVYYRTF